MKKPFFLKMHIINKMKELSTLLLFTFLLVKGFLILSFNFLSNL